MGGISAIEPRLDAKNERQVVLDVREGFLRVWRADWGIPRPWGFRANDEMPGMCEGKARLGDATLHESFGCTRPYEMKG